MARRPFVSLEISRSSLAVVTRALQQAGDQIRREGSQELVTLGQLVEHDAERLARGRVVGASIGGVDWSAMRTGVSPAVVYVVPQQHGTKVPTKKRPNFSQLMLTRAMRPALAGRRAEVYRRFQALTRRVCGAFNG